MKNLFVTSVLGLATFACTSERPNFEPAKGSSSARTNSGSDADAGPSGSFEGGASNDDSESATNTRPIVSPQSTTQSSSDVNPSGPASTSAPVSPTNSMSPTSNETSSTLDAGAQTRDPACDGCSIDDTCYSVNEVHPDNPCLVCDPDSSTKEWSSADGKACDDELYCTVEDKCEDGACVGEERSCEDDVECTGPGACDEASKSCEPGESVCNEGQTCSVETGMCTSNCTGCVIAGSCYADGAASTTNPCQVCDVSASTTAWSVAVGASCDDGDKCTNNDACAASGVCEGSAVVCTSEEGPCGAKRSCNPATGQCDTTYGGTSVTCDDGDACTEADKCDGAGACAGTEKACSDEHACTQDSCEDGECVHEVAADICLIDDTWCIDDEFIAEHDTCLTCDASKNQLAWTEKANCECGSDADCDDGLACTTDSCGNDNTCTHQLQNGKCLIDNACFDNGAAKAGNPCRVCDAAVDDSAWKLVNGVCGGNTYCDGRQRCWMTSDLQRQSSGNTFTQAEGTANCENWDAHGVEWALPSLEDADFLANCADDNCADGCFWPEAMGATCSNEYWTSAPSRSYVWSLATGGLWPAEQLLYVRCITKAL